MKVSYRLVAPGFVARVDVADGKVVFAAPILHWMRGWTQERLLDYVNSRGDWEIAPL